jgi:hypothetical protein
MKHTQFGTSESEAETTFPKRRSFIGLYILISLVFLVLVAILGVLVYKEGIFKMFVKQPQYDWQKTCDYECSTTVGESGMSNIDQMNCDGLEPARQLTQASVEFSRLDPTVNTNQIKESLKAMNDKYAALGCKPPKSMFPSYAPSQGMPSSVFDMFKQ